MKKRVLIVLSITIALLLIAALVTSYADSARVRNSVEPVHTIKIVSEDGCKVTYWGLGYKVVRYPSVSPNEPYKNNRGVKYGSWFMNYDPIIEDGTKEEVALIPMVKVNGVLYLDTGIFSTPSITNRTYDGEITSAVKSSEKPTENNQSNFDSGYGYVIGSIEGTIELDMDGQWRIFATEEVRQQLQFPNTEELDGGMPADFDKAKFEGMTVTLTAAGAPIVDDPNATFENQSQRHSITASVVKDIWCYNDMELNSNAFIIPAKKIVVILQTNDGAAQITYAGQTVWVNCVNLSLDYPTNTIQNNETTPQAESEQNTESEIADKNISSPTSSYPTFSYEEESAIYVEGQPGVKTSGFVNTSEIKLGFDNIAEHAKKECTVKYYTTQTYFDSSTGMWKVVFNDENILGGDQTVYMTKNGITTLIVYGE